MCRHCLEQILTLTTTLLVAKICTILKKIMRFQNRKTNMGFGEVICSVTEVARYPRKKKLSAIECESGNVEMQWNNIQQYVL
jgi:hypothetical protein